MPAHRSRRAFLSSAGVVVLAALAQHSSAGEMKPAATPMKIGIVGSGRLGGTVGLNKTTSGTVTLTGSNIYTGTTSVQAGTLNYGVNGALASTSRPPATLMSSGLSGPASAIVARPDVPSM